jgi:hypothetical protein
MGFESCRQDVRIGDRSFRSEDDVARGYPANMSQIAQNPDTVHLGHHFMPKSAKPGIAALVATGARKVLGIVGDLHDPHSEVLKERDIANLILERRGILKAEDDAGFSFRFGAADVGGGAHRSDQVGILGAAVRPPPACRQRPRGSILR